MQSIKEKHADQFTKKV